MNEKSQDKSDDLKKDRLEGFVEIELGEDGPKAPPPLRKEFRFPVRDRNDCWVIIGNGRYELCDVSRSGIGICNEPEVVLKIGRFLGDVLSNCTLNIMDQNISGVDYKMVHISPEGDSRMLCGLFWLNPTPENRQKIDSALVYLKTEAFKENPPGDF